jgi:hypothetical protein
MADKSKPCLKATGRASCLRCPLARHLADGSDHWQRASAARFCTARDFRQRLVYLRPVWVNGARALRIGNRAVIVASAVGFYSSFHAIRHRCRKSLQRNGTKGKSP